MPCDRSKRPFGDGHAIRRPDERQYVGTDMGGTIAVTDKASTRPSVALWCAHSGAHVLDRDVCAPPCEALHLRCEACGTALSGCPFESPAHHDSLVGRLLPLVSDESEALLVLAVVEQAGRSGLPVTWTAARSAVRGLAGRHRRDPAVAPG